MKYVFILLTINIVLFSGCMSQKTNNAINRYKLLIEDLKNVNTTGYKSHFKSIYTQGSLQLHWMKLSIAIEGKGFFKFKNPETGEIRYTRNGLLVINGDRIIVNQKGWILLPQIKLPENFIKSTIAISEYGKIIVYQVGNEKRVSPGKIILYKPKGKKIKRIKNNFIFEQSQKANNWKVHQGFLEMSTVIIQPTLLQIQQLLYFFREKKMISDNEFLFKNRLIQELRDQYRLIRNHYPIKSDKKDKTPDIRKQKINLSGIYSLEIKEIPGKTYREHLWDNYIQRIQFYCPFLEPGSFPIKTPGIKK